MKNLAVPLCPRCGSSHVKNVYLMSPTEIALPSAKHLKKQLKKIPIVPMAIGWQPQNPSIYVCKECDYYGICPDVKIDKVKEFKKKLKKK